MNPSLLSQARELKSKLDKAQKELSTTMVEASAGKGAVKVIMNGQQKIQSIKISPQVINPDKAEVLEGLVLKAVSEAIDKAQKVAAKCLGGIKFPGLT
jgi:DNA-binding YbaB/EbfC family protein